MRRFDIFIIGGGGTGSEIAFQLAHAGGFAIGLAEHARLGGVCNHTGCVPTKAMLRSAKLAALARTSERFGVTIPQVEVDLSAVMARVRGVIDAQSGAGAEPFEKLGVSVLMDHARLVGPHEVEMADGTHVMADRIVLATGSIPSHPSIAGLERTPFWTNREAIWTPTAVPASLAIIGTGAIGLEFGQMYARFGSRVTMVEAAPRILPGEDEDAAAAMLPVVEEEGIDVRTDAEIRRVDRLHQGWRLDLGRGEVVDADELLVATGREPDLAGHDLDGAGVSLREDGTPRLTNTLRTSAPSIWVAGDATGERMFTHVGDYEAGLVVDDVLGNPRSRDYRAVPRVTFTDPEVASVGLTEEEARAVHPDVRTSVARLVDNERAKIDGAPHGMVKLVQDASTGELLGGHIVADGAGSMIHELVIAMAGRLPITHLGGAIHAYPTLAASIRDAASALDDGPRRSACVSGTATG